MYNSWDGHIHIKNCKTSIEVDPAQNWISVSAQYCSWARRYTSSDSLAPTLIFKNAPIISLQLNKTQHCIKYHLISNFKKEANIPFRPQNTHSLSANPWCRFHEIRSVATLSSMVECSENFSRNFYNYPHLGSQNVSNKTLVMGIVGKVGCPPWQLRVWHRKRSSCSLLPPKL